MEETQKAETQKKDLDAFLVSYAVGTSVFFFMVSRSPIMTRLDANIFIISGILIMSLPILIFVVLSKKKTK